MTENTTSTPTSLKPMTCKVMDLINADMAEREITIDEIVAKRNKLLAQANDHRIARELIARFEEMGIDWHEIPDEVTKKDGSQVDNRQKKDLLQKYEDWQYDISECEEAITTTMADLREIVAEINKITGDRTIHKTYEKGGNKAGARGERINHGNRYILTDLTTKKTVPHPNGGEEWKSINEAVRHFAEEDLSIEYEMVVDGTGKRVRRLDDHGQPIPILREDGSFKRYNVNEHTGINILRAHNIEAKPVAV